MLCDIFDVLTDYLGQTALGELGLTVQRHLLITGCVLEKSGSAHSSLNSITFCGYYDIC
jgi:hypothetical protein